MLPGIIKIDLPEPRHTFPQLLTRKKLDHTIALDIARFTPLATFTAEVDRHLGDLRASRTLPGFDAVRLPGEERRRRRADRVANGVPMASELIAQLDGLATDLALVPLRGR